MDYFLDELISSLVSKMSENGEKCASVFPKAQDDVLKCLALSTTPRYSAYCHRGEKKLEQYSHLRSWNQIIFTFVLKSDSNRLIDYQNSWRLI